MFVAESERGVLDDIAKKIGISPDLQDAVGKFKKDYGNSVRYGRERRL